VIVLIALALAGVVVLLLSTVRGRR